MAKPTGTFRLSEYRNRTGSLSWRVSGTPRTLNAKRIQLNFALKSDAVAKMQQLQDESLGVESLETLRRTILTLDQLRDAETALNRLAGACTLTAAAEVWLAQRKNVVASELLGSALEKFLAEKRQSGRRARTLDNLETRLGALSRAVGKDLPIRTLTSDALRAVAFRDGCSPATARNYLLAFSSFTRWALKRDLIDSDPVDRIDKPRIDSKEPGVLTIRQCEALLQAAVGVPFAASAVAYMVLGLFGAIRPGELARLRPADINLDTRTVTIKGAAAKRRARRLVDLQPNAVEWLKRFWDGKARLHLAREEFEEVRAKAGITKWVSDGLRHTGITCHLVQFGDEGRTALWAGNSPDIIHAHYRGLMPAADAAKFWAIMPAEEPPKTPAFGTKPGAMLEGLLSSDIKFEQRKN